MTRRALTEAAHTSHTAQIVTISVHDLLAEVRESQEAGAASMRANFATLQEALDARERALADRERQMQSREDQNGKLHGQLNAAYAELQKCSEIAAKLVLVDAKKAISLATLEAERERHLELMALLDKPLAMLGAHLNGGATKGARTVKETLAVILDHAELCQRIQDAVGTDRWTAVLDWAVA